MDKESVLQKEIVQSTVRFSSFQPGFCFCALVKCSELLPANSGSDKGKLIFGGTLFFIMFLSQFALNLKYYLIDKKKWRIAEGILLIFCIGLTIFRILNPGHYLMEFL